MLMKIGSPVNLGSTVYIRGGRTFTYNAVVVMVTLDSHVSKAMYKHITPANVFSQQVYTVLLVILILFRRK